MVKQIKGILYLFIMNFRYTFLIFWSILTTILAVCLVASSLLLNIDEAMFIFGFPFATYIFAAIFGFQTVKEIVPFALKIGAIRKNLFLAFGLFFLGVALFQAIFANIMQVIAELIIDVAGLHIFHFVHLAQLLESSNWILMVMIDTIAIFLVLTIFFIFGLLFYRGGMIVGGAVTGILAILLLLDVALGWSRDYLIELFYSIDIIFFIQLFGFSLILFGLTYFLINRITTVKKR